MAPPATQKALAVTKLGQPVELLNDWPVSRPGRNQVLLKVTVAGLNPHDEKTRQWGLFAPKLPSVIGNDLTGTVVALGPEVTRYQIGDRVVSQPEFVGNYAQNALQEYAIHDVGAGCKIPDSITDDEAATLPTNLIAPFVGLFSTAHGLGIPAPWTEEAKSFDYKNTALLIIGGGSSCGRFAVQLANLANIGNIVSVGGSKEELKGFGATHVLDRHGGEEAVLERIQRVVGDDLVYVFDAINPPETLVLGMKALSCTKRGRLARLLPTDPPDTSSVLGKKAGFDVVNVYGSSQVQPDLAYPFWDRVPEYLTTGKLKPLTFVVKNGLTAENVNTTLDDYRDGVKVTKTHIHI
jgi:NADPH2:quinone reductase